MLVHRWHTIQSHYVPPSNRVRGEQSLADQQEHEEHFRAISDSNHTTERIYHQVIDSLWKSGAGPSWQMRSEYLWKSSNPNNFTDKSARLRWGFWNIILGRKYVPQDPPLKVGWPTLKMATFKVGLWSIFQVGIPTLPWIWGKHEGNWLLDLTVLSRKSR